MAVVTEPPWINKTTGTTLASGTTATLPLGFTPTSGNFLVVVVGGGVTNTNATWTERVAPVSSGELSVFTKTSDGTETTFVDTVNGANWTVNWTAYEFPAGTTWTSSTSANPTTDVFPQLTGLPGTAQMVFGALTNNVSIAGLTNFTAVWSNPWVADAVLFFDKPATGDGSVMTVGHQINVTATSATPAATITRTGGTSAADKQTVTFALDVAALLAAPTVDALGDRYLSLGATLDRVATVAANGATVTAQGWSLQSGAGSPATLSSSATLSWTPSSLGTYGLRYSATNSQGTTTQDITVTVVDGVWHKDAMSDMYRMGRF